MRKLFNLALTLPAIVFMTACITDDAAIPDEGTTTDELERDDVEFIAASSFDRTSSDVAELVPARGIFALPYVRTGELRCLGNQVMIGIHYDAPRMALCAPLNAGYSVVLPGYRDAFNNATHLYGMHSCAPGYFIQAISDLSTPRKTYTCVKIKKISTQQIMTYSNVIIDGPGPNNNGTRSTVYGVSQNFHACAKAPNGGARAMVGFHRDNNDLACAY